MNGALEHERRPPFRYNSRGSTPQRQNSSAVRVTSRHCGQRGHYSTVCPTPPTDRKSEPSAGRSTTMSPTLPSEGQPGQDQQQADGDDDGQFDEGEAALLMRGGLGWFKGFALHVGMINWRSLPHHAR